MHVRIGIAAFLVTASLFAQIPSGIGIVYGRNHAFAVQAPRGWMLDNTSGREQGLHAVFYESGKTWASADVVMYANAASKDDAGQSTVEQLIAYDVAKFRERAPQVRVTEAAEIRTDTGCATVRRFEGDQYGNYEAVAYVDESRTVIMLVLSARSKARFDEAYPAFEELVGSYRFLTANVTIEP